MLLTIIEASAGSMDHHLWNMYVPLFSVVKHWLTPLPHCLHCMRLHTTPVPLFNHSACRLAHTPPTSRRLRAILSASRSLGTTTRSSCRCGVPGAYNINMHASSMAFFSCVLICWCPLRLRFHLDLRPVLPADVDCMAMCMQMFVPVCTQVGEHLNRRACGVCVCACVVVCAYARVFACICI